MDPLSVTSACVGLLSGIFALSKQISAFAIGTRDAHKDMQAFSKELISLQLCLESLREERITSQFPDKLKQSLLVIIASCSDIVDQMSTLLARHSSGNIGRRMQWSMFSRDEAEKLRNNLEAHKSAIEIALSVSAIAVGADLKDDTTTIKAELSFLPEIKQDTGQISELRTEIQALKFQIMQIGQPQTATDETLNTFLDESIAYTESTVETRSTLDVEPPSGRSTLDNVALTQTTTSSSDTTSLLSNPFSTPRSSTALSIYSTATSLFEFWEPLESVTTTHPNAIPLDRHAIEASHRTRKRFPKWKKDELDQLLADAVACIGADRHSPEQISKCKSLLNLGAKIQHSVGHTDNLSSYGTLARELHFGGRHDLVTLLLSRGARVNHADFLVRNACLAEDSPTTIELLLNQGCDADALLRSSLEVLNLPGLKLLLSRGANIGTAIDASLKVGWISGMDYSFRIPISPQGSILDARSVQAMRDWAGSSYVQDLSTAFVRNYVDIMRSNPTLETEIQLRKNYDVEVKIWFPECNAPSPQVIESRSMGMFGKKESWTKLEKKKLTSQLHFSKMNKVIWDSKTNKIGN